MVFLKHFKFYYHVLTCLFLFANTAVLSHLLQMFEKKHFYELSVERHDEVKGLNLVQSFSYHIFGQDFCTGKFKDAFIARSFKNPDDSYDTLFNLKAETFIYSNYEQTLSFLIQISFTSLNKINNLQIQGFELEFKFEDKSTCIQIIPDNEKFIQGLPNKYKLTIKDPAFLSQNQDYYQFYFGKVIVRPLVNCDSKLKTLKFNSKNLCSIESSSTNYIPIGISSVVRTIPDASSIDTCPGHVLGDTCLMRYSYPSVTPDPYIIIVHPMPDAFSKMNSDIDFLNLDKEQMKLLEDARKRGKQTVKIGKNEYPTHSLSNDGNVKAVSHIESYDYQKFPKGIVIKFLIHSSESIHFVSFFKESTSKNVCPRKPNEILGCYCAETDKCSDCYHEEELNNKTIGIKFIPMNRDDTDTKILKNKFCNTKPFLRPYNFDMVKMELNFQKQLLSNPRQKHNTNEIQLFNREFLPRICFNINYGRNRGFFNIKLIFNDYYQTAQNPLTDAISYEFNLYTYEYDDLSEANYYENIQSDDLFKVNAKLVHNMNKPLMLNDQLEIRNLVQSKYILEVIPKQQATSSNIICPKTGYCLDESTRNNEIQCNKCNKLIVVFVLENGMLRDQQQSNVNSRNLNKIEDSIRKANLTFDQNVIYKCSKDSVLLENSLLQSLNLSDLIHKSFKTDKGDSRLIKNDYREIIAAKVPGDFNLNSFYLPFIKITYQYQQAEDYTIHSPSESNLFYIYILVPIFIIVLFVVILVYHYCFKITQNDKPKKADYKKKIVFYLSIDVENSIQNDLKQLIQPYIQILPKKFSQMNIDIIDFKTNRVEKRKLMDESDLILYVCCTDYEIKKLFAPMKLGLNSYHHDFNLIHFHNKFQKKCLNITFNTNIKETKNDDSNQMTLNELNRPSTSSSSSSSSSLLQNIGNSVYLKLPDQNEQFISDYLLGPSNDLNNNNNNLYEKIRPYLSNESIPKIISKIQNQVRKRLKMYEKLANLDINISYDGQPDDDESIIEEEDSVSNVETLISSDESATLLPDKKSN